ncbi:MAG TPA: Gfo/Idh/MocA family oxidoreductase [Spirochaetia bacterium]|nr:Gfo/Idh/MocA family oxidoreductase [Spirochaetia bacterium]
MKIIQIGSGGWGKSWLKIIHETEGCELVGLVSQGGANLQEAKSSWSIEDNRCFTNLDEALDREADLVVVSVPHHLHIEYAKRAMGAGKNVLIEKPLSDEFAQAKQFAQYAEGRTERAWVSQNFRNRSALWNMRASLTEQGAGNPLWVHVQFRQGDNTKVPRPWRREGWRRDQWSFLMNEIIIHHFDMLRFLLDDEPQTVQAQGWNPPWCLSSGPEVLSAQIEFRNGVHVDYSGTTEGLGMQTGWQGHWFVQTDRASLRWEGDELSMDPARDENPKIVEAADFPGFDRNGILTALSKGVKGAPCAVPTVSDNLLSFAFAHAAELSVREHRAVTISEIVDWESS